MCLYNEEYNLVWWDRSKTCLFAIDFRSLWLNRELCVTMLYVFERLSVRHQTILGSGFRRFYLFGMIRSEKITQLDQSLTDITPEITCRFLRDSPHRRNKLSNRLLFSVILVRSVQKRIWKCVIEQLSINTTLVVRENVTLITVLTQFHALWCTNLTRITGRICLSLCFLDELIGIFLTLSTL